MQLNIKNSTNLLLFPVFLLAWWLTASFINPQLHYYLQQSAFLTELSFFKSYARYPGGLADYLSEFVTQFFYFKILGSFLIVLTAAMVGIIALYLVERITGKIKLGFSIVGLILLLSVINQCNYYYPFYASIRLLVAAGFIVAFTGLSARFTRWRHTVSFLLAILLFYIAGGAALFVYTISVILLQIHFYGTKNDRIILPILAIFSVILPYLSYKTVFLVNLPLVYDLTHSKSPEILYYAPDYKLYALYALLPLYVAMAILYNRYKLRSERTRVKVKPERQVSNKKGIKNHDTRTAKKEGLIKASRPTPPLIWGAGQMIAFTILAGFSIHYSLDKTIRNKLLVSYYASKSDWNMVLQSAKDVKEYDLFTNVEYNRALANTGKLTDNLFSYAQLAGPSGLFIDEKVTSDIPFICCDQYFDLGFMHEAQHWAFEAQTIFPNSPRLLKRLVQINLVNGRYDLARKFLHQLDENMLYGDWVEHYQRYIDDTTLIERDPELSWKRKCEPVENFAASNPFLKLIKLLEANPNNKMALDYLLCATLLDGDLGSFKDLMTKYPIYNKAPLPGSLDEAMAFYYYRLRKAPGPGDIACSKEKQEQFATFVKAIKPFGKDWRQARVSLQKDFGNTYWYYLSCLSPQVTKAQIKRQ